MIGFVLALLWLTYTIVRVASETIQGKIADYTYDRASERRDAFMDSIEASQEIMDRIHNNNNYSDIAADVSYIFGREYRSSEIQFLSENSRKVFGGERTWKEVAEELRLSKIGKCRRLWNFQAHGIRFCDNSDYRPCLERYYEILRRNFAENGIVLHRYIDPGYQNILHTMTFDKMTLNHYLRNK